MLKYGFSFLFALLAVASVASAKDPKANHLGPVYIDRVPPREKAIIEKPQFEKRPRESVGIIRPSFDKPGKLHSTREKPGFDLAQRDPSVWDKTVLETKWTDDNQADLERFPQEKRDRKSANRHRVHKGGRVRAR